VWSTGAEKYSDDTKKKTHGTVCITGENCNFAVTPENRQMPTYNGIILLGK